mmetsp:Transcript_27217/g.63745  ORF Transcript_27217/g.63745 Transcript_27217/m.63745 type:complete len:91 (+) Transcript_27217:1285-1557(+)
MSSKTDSLMFEAGIDEASASRVADIVEAEAAYRIPKSRGANCSLVRVKNLRAEFWCGLVLGTTKASVKPISKTHIRKQLLAAIFIIVFGF